MAGESSVMTDVVPPIKYINIKEFRERGYLQEANRRFFHPLGLALEITVDDKTGEETLSGVWDYREDPEGMTFGSPDNYGLNPMKAANVDGEIRAHAKARKAIFGQVIQPLDNVLDKR
jgi:hypothetical protein